MFSGHNMYKKLIAISWWDMKTSLKIISQKSLLIDYQNDFQPQPYIYMLNKVKRGSTCVAVCLSEWQELVPSCLKLPEGKHSDLRLMYEYCEEEQKRKTGWKKWRGGWYLTNIRLIHSVSKSELVLWAKQATNDSDEMWTVLEATSMQAFLPHFRFSPCPEITRKAFFVALKVVLTVC